MPTLYILDDDEGESQLIAVKLGKIDHKAATVEILNALKAIEPEKKTRSDRGKKREPRLLATPPSNGDPVL